MIRPAVIELRRHQRYETRFGVHFKSKRDFVEEYAANISYGGLFVETNEALELHSVIEIELMLPDSDKPARTKAAVVHVSSRRGSSGVGLQFVDMSDEFRERLDRYIEKLASEA